MVQSRFSFGFVLSSPIVKLFLLTMGRQVLWVDRPQFLECGQLAVFPHSQLYHRRPDLGKRFEQVNVGSGYRHCWAHFSFCMVIFITQRMHLMSSLQVTFCGYRLVHWYRAHRIFGGSNPS